MEHRVETIYSELGASLRGFILQRVSDPQTADDILQDVFLKIYTHLDTLRDDAKVSSWVYQIARNAIIDHYRKREDAPLPDVEQIELPAEDERMRAALAASVACMLERLPAEYQSALRMDALEGVPQADIAARLGLSPSGAKSRVQRARHKLRAMLLDCCQFEFDRRGGVIDVVPRSNCCSEC